MITINNDEDWINFRKSHRQITWNKLNDETKYFLLKRYTDNFSNNEIDILKESSYRIINKIEEVPKCPICGKSCAFVYGKGGYVSNCRSKDCKRAYRIKRNNEIYGSNSPFGNKAIIDKCKETRLNKYGHEYYSNWEKSKQTCLEKYGTTSWLSSEESKNRLKEKYGVEYGFQSKEIWEKTRQATIEKYGAAYNIDKYKNTMLNKYGKEWFVQTKEFQDKIDHDLMAKHCYETQKKNGTLKTSKVEDESFNKLKELFPNIKRNYKEDIRYPFKCDFYIPELDLFIECQYGFFHNKRPFTNSEQDKQESILLNEKSKIIKNKTGKSKSRYDALINTWTIRDVNKRNIANKNKLNYIEVWTIEEFNDLLLKLKNNFLS